MAINLIQTHRAKFKLLPIRLSVLIANDEIKTRLMLRRQYMAERHVLEALGKAYVVVEDGKVLQVGEPLIRVLSYFC